MGLHAAPVTGKNALVAARALSSAFWQFSNSSGVTTIKRKIVLGHLNRSFENIGALVPWDRLTGAGTCGVTCLDQLHCALDRLLDWLQLYFEANEFEFSFFMSGSDRPYRAITLDTRSSVAKTSGRVSTHALTWLNDCIDVGV